MKSFLIDLPTLPEEGKSFSGEISGEIFDLPKGHPVSTGPLEYSLYVQRFGSELLLTGSLSAPFEFTCVRTLDPFIQTIRVDPAAVSIDIGRDSVIDAGEALREEILLAFPINPRCEDGDEPREGRIDPRYLAVDKPSGTGVETPPREAGDDRWAALDDLKNIER